MNILSLLQQIVSHTPRFVWGILAFCIAMGAMQRRDQWMTRRRVLRAPLIWSLFGLWGMASAFGLHLQGVLAWMLGLGLTAVVLIRVDWPTGAGFDRSSERYFVPGSWQPMAMIMTIFTAKYAVGASLALMPQLAQVVPFEIAVSALYGALSGLFIARAGNSCGSTGAVAMHPTTRSLRDNEP